MSCCCSNFTFDHFNKRLDHLERVLAEIKKQGEHIMAQETDLQAAIASVGQALTRLQSDVTTIIDKLKTSGSIPDADIQALSAVSTGIGAAADSIEAALNPPVA